MTPRVGRRVQQRIQSADHVAGEWLAGQVRTRVRGGLEVVGHLHIAVADDGIRDGVQKGLLDTALMARPACPA